MLRSVLLLVLLFTPCYGFTAPVPTRRAPTGRQNSGAVLTMSSENPTTFREAEVLGLKLMQEEKYEDALKAFQEGLKLPGSKKDVVRTKSLSGPSPVGGSTGGFESKNTMTLDQFELQAANYNMACAYAQLGDIDNSIASLEKAFQNGFDNFATVRADPDLNPIKATPDFEALMEAYEPKQKSHPPWSWFQRN